VLFGPYANGTKIRERALIETLENWGLKLPEVGGVVQSEVSSSRDKI
jgi:hypothetical protein